MVWVPIISTREKECHRHVVLWICQYMYTAYIVGYDNVLCAWCSVSSNLLSIRTLLRTNGLDALDIICTKCDIYIRISIIKWVFLESGRKRKYAIFDSNTQIDWIWVFISFFRLCIGNTTKWIIRTCAFDNKLKFWKKNGRSTRNLANLY